MFGFDVRRSELAGFVSREEDHAPGLFCVAFKHGYFSEYFTTMYTISLPSIFFTQCGTPAGTLMKSPLAMWCSSPPAMLAPRISPGPDGAPSTTDPPVTKTHPPSITYHASA